MQTEDIQQRMISKENMDFRCWPNDLLIDYALKIHHRGVRTNGKKIMSLLNDVIEKQEEKHKELEQVRTLFRNSLYDLEEHLQKEEQILFPYLYRLFEANRNNEEIEGIHCGEVMYPINAMMEDHANEELRYEKISNLTNSYKRSSKEDSDYNLLMQKLNSFEDNLHEHIYIENQIIFPNAITVERDMQEKGKVVE